MFKLVGYTAGVALYAFVANPGSASAEPLKVVCERKACSTSEQGRSNILPPASLIPPPPEFPPRMPAPTGVPVKPQSGG